MWGGQWFYISWNYTGCPYFWLSLFRRWWCIALRELNLLDAYKWRWFFLNALLQIISYYFTFVWLRPSLSSYQSHIPWEQLRPISLSLLFQKYSQISNSFSCPTLDHLNFLFMSDGCIKGVWGTQLLLLDIGHLEKWLSGLEWSANKHLLVFG